LNLHGLDTIAADLAQPTYLVKCVLTDGAVAFFPATMQHADVHVGGMRYADDAKGNALAATISPRKFAIRLHSKFPPELVAGIVTRLLAREEMTWARAIPVSYGDQSLSRH
jgi:hypothetical protein